jgi:hypothetical protein
MQVKAFWQERRQRRLEIAARVSGRRCRLAGPKSRVWGIYINIYQDLTNSAAESPFFPIGWRKKNGGINIKTAKTDHARGATSGRRMRSSCRAPRLSGCRPAARQHFWLRDCVDARC